MQFPGRVARALITCNTKNHVTTSTPSARIRALASLGGGVTGGYVNLSRRKANGDRALTLGRERHSRWAGQSSS